MVDTLVNLSQIMPIGFCTGRQLESFERNGLNEIVEKMDLGKKDKFLENLYLFAENGALGYDFSPQTQKFEEFYKVPWPEELIKRDLLKEMINEAVADYGDIYENAHRVVIVIRTKLHDIDTRDINQVYELSEKIYEATKELLKNIAPDYEQYLHVGNSGLGVIVGPANGDKDHGIKEFAKILKERCNFDFNDKLREIIVFGDSGHVGGNDHFFLKGDIGSAYSVGEFFSEKGYPKPVIDSNGKRLFNAKGTIHFINSEIIE
jgi:hydroxymethylpyrimidine pyrophosphatase-like HAD family hydrolase